MGKVGKGRLSGRGKGTRKEEKWKEEEQERKGENYECGRKGERMR